MRYLFQVYFDNSRNIELEVLNMLLGDNMGMYSYIWEYIIF